MSVTPIALSEHDLGFKGHFEIDEDLQRTASRYGLRIRKAEDAYTVAIPNDNMPPQVFGKDALKDHLRFIHQPIKMSIEQAVAATHGNKKPNEIAAIAAEQRLYMHQLLRFATTSSTAIPKLKDESIQHSYLNGDDHVEIEREMKSDDIWRTAKELGNGSNSPLPCTIPGIDYDPKAGFNFHLHPNTSGELSFARNEQRSLNTWLWKAVEKVTKGRIQDDPAKLQLSADEFTALCTEAHHAFENPDPEQSLALLIERVTFDEKVQRALKSVERRAQSLKGSDSLSEIHMHSPHDPLQPAQHVSNMLHCSSAVALAVQSAMLQTLWRRYNFSERNHSPAREVGAELAIMQATLAHYADKGHISRTELEALNEEFYGQLSFSYQISGVIVDAIDQQKKPSAEALQLKQRFADIRTALDACSVTGLAETDRYLDDNQKKILSTVSRALSKHGSVIQDTFKAAATSTLGFTLDILNFIRESPKTAAIFGALVTTLIIANNGGDASQAAAATPDFSSVMVFGDTDLVQVAIDPTSLSEEARKSQSWHWDMGPLGMYKHYMFDNAVVGPAQTALDTFRAAGFWLAEHAGLTPNTAPAFSQAAEATVKPVAEHLFNLNMFQNFTHAAFWMYMLSRGAEHGPKSFSKLGKFFAPMTDLSYQAAIRSLESARIARGFSRSERLEKLLGGGKTLPDIKLAQNIDGDDIPLPQFNQDIREGRFDIKIGRLKKIFEINANNREEVISTLHKINLSFAEIDTPAASAPEWYVQNTKAKISSVLEALDHYQANGDPACLQDKIDEHLADLIGVEIYTKGRTRLYKALFNAEAEKSESSILRRTAQNQEGQLKRLKEIYIETLRLQGIDGERRAWQDIKSQASILSTSLAGILIDATRSLQNKLDEIPTRGILKTFAGAGGAVVALDMSGVARHLSPSMQDAINHTSSALGTVVSTATTTATFLIYNVGEDVLGVHLGTGAILVSIGTAYYYVNKHGIKPLLAARREAQRTTPLEAGL